MTRPANYNKSKDRIVAPSINIGITLSGNVTIQTPAAPTDTAIFWEIRLIQDNGAGVFGLSWIDLRDPDGNSVTAGCTITASSTFNDDPSLQPTNLLVRSFTEFSEWVSQTGANEYVRFELASAAEVYEIGIAPRTNVFTRTPQEFEVWKSDDGVTWTEVKAYSGLTTGWEAGPRYFAATAPDVTPLVDAMRVEVQFLNGGGLVDWYEVEFLDGGVDQATGGTASASSEFDAVLTAAKAFDGLVTETSRWASEAGVLPQSIQYVFPVPRKANAISINPFAADRAPAVCRVLTSSDGGSTFSHFRTLGKTVWTPGVANTINFTT